LLAAIFTFAADPSKTAGRKTCLRCHQLENRTLAATGHDDDRSCEQCHGPGEAHLRLPQTPGTMFDFDRSDAAEVRSRCGQCHRNPAMERHAAGDVSCIACHSIHHYAQKKHLLKPDDADRGTSHNVTGRVPFFLSQN
jgi:hypothetical protein